MIAKIFILLGKIGITGGNMVSCYYIMKLVFKDFEDDQANGDMAVSSAAFPLILVGCISFLTASIFLGVLDTAVISLLTCLGIDIDHNGEESCAAGPPTFHDKRTKMHEDYKTADDFAAMEEGGEEERSQKVRESFLYHLVM